MSDTRKDDFLKDLQALINKHDVELTVTDDGKDYGMHSGICVVTFRFDPDLSFLEFEIPSFMRPED